jgi:type IV pilus assembly protein PilY1
LFLSTNVQPNIFFMIDDSGSMDWEVLKSKGVENITAYAGFPNSGDIDITPTRDDRDEILGSCVGYNVLYFDPAKTYTPWVGVDINDDAYLDQSITSALLNPYDPGSGTGSSPLHQALVSTMS